MILFRNFSKFFSVVGQIMAFATIIIIGLVYLSEAINIPFITLDFIEKLKSGEFKKVLLISTGALMSTTTNQQGDSIPGIAHLVMVERR